MEKYKYVLGRTPAGGIIFVVASASSTFSFEELLEKMNVDVFISQGELLSTEKAFTLPPAEAEHQSTVDGLDRERFYIGDLMHFGNSHRMLFTCAEIDDNIMSRVVRNMSWTDITSSGFTFA